MSVGMSSDEDAIPSREICEERCDQFASITGTDSALAMFFLQDRNWNLEESINAYFESEATNVNAKQDLRTGAGLKLGPQGSGDVVNDEEPNRLRLLSWNIDGLDPKNLQTRTNAVCKKILEEKPDVVFLQEVIEASLSILEAHCIQYFIIPGGETTAYFTAVMLRISSAVYRDHQVIPFPNSRMMRTLLIVNARIKSLDVQLMTSHLESCKEHGERRKKQLQVAFSQMLEASEEKTVLFGGDLNVRDNEIDVVGRLPSGVVDLWEVTGEREEAKYTWDMKRNINLQWSHKFRPRCRFDRIYMRHSLSKPVLNPVYFELVGLEKLQECGRFASDHWGLLAHFDKVDK